MKNNIKSVIFLLAALSLILISCSNTSDSPEDKEAQLMSLNDIRTSTGYAWFDIEYNSFVPDSNLIKQIRTAYSGSGLEFLVFVNPSCNCVGTQKRFPQFIRILLESGVPEQNIDIYSMLVYNAPHPFKSAVTLKALPGMFVMSNGASKYSILDSLDYYIALEPNNNHIMEEFVLKGVK